MTRIQLRNVPNIIVDHGVLQALSCVIKDLCLDGYVLKGHFSPLVNMSLITRHQQILLHFLVDSWKKDDILSSIFEHLLTQRSDRVPESFILLHLLGDFQLLSILNFIAKVFLQ